MSLKACPRCGHQNRQEAPTCPSCETTLPARHTVLRTAWMMVAIPFSIISMVALIMVIGGMKRGGAGDAASFTNMLCLVLVPSCIALIGWVNYLHHRR